ncbi:uncharacterized protein LOC135211421 [Macrobrachium nipponense]|uniref:uncharacterized protein LOC135211421 n=1 Tax=Macrobrachium nipponense TaxID=159736 RepID=UPI0030C7D2B4
MVKAAGLRMLVDTGAMHLVFPLSAEDRSCAPDDQTANIAAKGAPICTYSTRTQSITFLGRTYTWPFVLADVRTPLLGADFLDYHGLLVGVTRQHLLNTKTCLSCPLTTGLRAPTICSILPHHRYASLLQEFPDVFHPELRQVAGAVPKHGVYHYIETKGPGCTPSSAAFRRSSSRKPRPHSR